MEYLGMLISLASLWYLLNQPGSQLPYSLWVHAVKACVGADDQPQTHIGIMLAPDV